MKKQTIMENCWRNFLMSHPELVQQTGNQITAILYQEKIIYSKVAMDFTIKYMQDEKLRTGDVG